jgi:two-component system, cell cycle response regulator DivK
MFSPTLKSSPPSADSGCETSPSPKARLRSAFVNRQTPLILLVEDNADSCDMLRTLLELWNFEVIIARDGEEAIALAGQQKPDLILMDVRIPVVDGVEATRRIREFAPPDQMPVIFVSGHAQPGFRLVALAAGGNDFLTKPLDFKELEQILDKYVRKRETSDDSGLQ